MSAKSFAFWIRQSAIVVLAYLIASNLVASLEEWLEMVYTNNSSILEIARWIRKLGRVLVWILFLKWLKMPWWIVGLALVTLYFSVYCLAGNFVANSCALLLAWSVFRRDSAESSSAPGVDSAEATDNPQ